MIVRRPLNATARRVIGREVSDEYTVPVCRLHHCGLQQLEIYSGVHPSAIHNRPKTFEGAFAAFVLGQRAGSQDNSCIHRTQTVISRRREAPTGNMKTLILVTLESV